MRRAQLTAIALIAGVLSGCAREESTERSAQDVDLVKGEAASKVACSMCHVYPEPGLLEKSAWHVVLNRMRLLAGIEKPDLQRMNNPELAGNTNVFPAHPLFEKELWQSIEAYYLAHAPEHQPKLNRPALSEKLALFKPERLGYSVPSPTTTFVSCEEGGRAILFADAKTETIYSISEGAVAWSLDTSNIVTSVRSSGAARYIVGIGDFFPTDDRLGEVLVYDPFSSGALLKRVVTDLPRVTHLEPADLNHDGKMDFALSIFGNLLGRFSWFEGDGDGFNEHVLFEKPGALKSVAHDFNHDGMTDLAVLVAQATETLLIYTNLGNGRFANGEIFKKPPSYGHTDFELADMNSDGRVDFLVANGDNADFHTEPRPYQGIRIYISEGAGFREAYFFPFCGVYRVLARDFDSDGDQDIAAISFFPDYSNGEGEPFVYLENKGNFQFEAATFEGANIGRWLAMDAGDVDGDGDIDVALGAMVEMPDRAPAQLKQIWQSQSPSVLVLRNQRF